MAYSSKKCTNEHETKNSKKRKSVPGTQSNQQGKNGRGCGRSRRFGQQPRTVEGRASTTTCANADTLLSVAQLRATCADRSAPLRAVGAGGALCVALCTVAEVRKIDSKSIKTHEIAQKTGDEPLRCTSLQMSKNERSAPRAMTAEQRARHGYPTHQEFPGLPPAPRGGGDVYRPKAKNSLRATFSKLRGDDEKI